MTPERRFHQLTKEVEYWNYEEDSYWFGINKSGRFFFDYNSETNDFYCSYKEIWSILKSEFGLNYNQTMDIVKMGLGDICTCKVNSIKVVDILSDGNVKEYFKGYKK